MGNCFCMKVRKESNRGISVADQPAINLSTFFHHYTRSTCSTTRNKDIRRGTFAALLWLGSGRGGKRRSTRALHLDKAVGAELRRPVGALRGRLRDGAEVGEEPAQQRLRGQRERRACLNARPETAASRGAQPIICNVAFRESLYGRTLPAPGYCINFTVSINSDPSFSVSAFRFTTRSSHGASVTDSRRPFGRLRTTDCGRTQSMFST